MRKKMILTLALAGCLVLTAASSGLAERATRVSDAIWAHGVLYSTVLTPTSFTLPPLHSTDILYNFMMSGLQGQRSVSESAPGDRNYNGGRWAVKMVVFTDEGKAVHDPDDDGMVNFELQSAEQVLHHQTLGHLKIMETSFYFECPMLRGKGPSH